MGFFRINKTIADKDDFVRILNTAYLSSAYGDAVHYSVVRCVHGIEGDNFTNIKVEMHDALTQYLCTKDYEVVSFVEGEEETYSEEECPIPEKNTHLVREHDIRVGDYILLKDVRYIPKKYRRVFIVMPFAFKLLAIEDNVYTIGLFDGVRCRLRGEKFFSRSYKKIS